MGPVSDGLVVSWTFGVGPVFVGLLVIGVVLSLHAVRVSMVERRRVSFIIWWVLQVGFIVLLVFRFMNLGGVL